MSQERNAANSPSVAAQLGRGQTPSPAGLRHRPALRSTAFSPTPKENEGLNRRSSFFSETFSETHRSLRTTTDDLFLPRVTTTTSHDDQIETSHWHSVPLGLALLPAVGGLFFKDGSAVVTDITLLGLAAIFLNWALRLPWEWYKAAQATVTFEEPPLMSSPIEEDEEGELDGQETGAAKTNGDIHRAHGMANFENSDDEEIVAAQHELRMHELSALLACFMFPMLGAWLLHAIRAQLSRPSEGLVSNYNLTIFLLVAEIRPLSHMIKLVQRRTLFLQRKVNTKVLQQQRIEEKQDVTDMSRRLEELEAHVANIAATPAPESSAAAMPPDVLVSRAASQASADLRKAFQPELDALNRAMRRYEKRMTITAIQVEARLQDLETRLKDVVSLAAAAQRSADKHPRNYISILTNWICALVVVPTQYLYSVFSLPGKVVHAVLDSVKSILNLNHRTRSKDGTGMQRTSTARPRSAQKKGKAVA